MLRMQNLFRCFNSSAIVLTPANGELKIDLEGDIAYILTLASERKKPAALGDGLIEQVKLVAGARYPLYRNKRLLPSFR